MAGTAAGSTGSDAIVVGEEWISEHYFTTDATKESFKARVLARRKEWDSRKDEATPRSRLTSSRAALLNAFSTLQPDDAGFATTVSELNQTVVDMLGYRRMGLDHKSRRPGHLRAVRRPDRHAPRSRSSTPCRVTRSRRCSAKDADNLVTPFLLDEKTEITSVARLLSTLFVSDDHKPAFALVLAGPHVLVAERERWPEGRYLAIDLQLVCERNDTKAGGELDRALTCLSEESLAPNAEGDIWWTETLAESVKHTVGVSKDLREGVRLSIEIIANEVVRRRAAQGLDPLPADRGSAAGQAVAAVPLPDPVPAVRRGLSRAGRAPGRCAGVRPRLQPGPDARAHPGGAADPASPGRHPPLRVPLRALPPGRPGPRPGAGRSRSTSGSERVETTGVIDGLTFRSLRADLFKPEATAHIDEVGLGNAALQEVLKHLLLSKETKGRDRGFISYAELGINQLGAVYEGLMSYTGFFAETDLYEVAKDGNSEKGSWVVPTSRAEGIADKDFVTTTDPVTGETKPVIHEQGAFVFRLAGRERQQSASYYTPEVLTRFVVSQALEELLDQDDTTTTAAEILELTICEPALGSGAFAIEAVRQLADEYLKRRQRELGETIDPDEYPRELQKVKAYLALHQVYGVDLNATAVELAEISLWLDTMVEGLEAPWFGLHLRRGNSLIGARKAVFTPQAGRGQVLAQGRAEARRRRSQSPDEAPSLAGRVPHFLLPADGWGAAADVGKDIKDLVPDAVRELKDWRKSMWAKPTKKQVDALVAMSDRVQRLWEIAQRRLEIANAQIRRDIPLWGMPTGGERR